MRLLVLLAILLTTTTVGAQDAVPVPPSIPPGDDVIEHVEATARAPFEGMLLDLDTAIRWTNRLTWWHETFRLHLAQDTEVMAALQRSHDRELTLTRESFEREITGLRTDLRDAVVRYEAELAAFRNPPFYETWGFAFGMGVVVVGVIVGVVAALAAGI